ncbi:MAG TPA: ABC transporter permease [Planctomycetaceae bacterium]|nr:ABC transporter permease [Planctomycetaceae bacterium]
MNWLKTWIIGIKSLMLKPMQSSLTILGIFIGVASVIWLLAIGEGISLEAQKQIEDLGANNIIIRTVKPSTQVTSENSGPMPYGVTREDHEKLLRIPTVKDAIQIRELQRPLYFRDTHIDGRVVGCTPEYSDLTHLEVADGRFLEDADLAAAKTYCVLAQKVAERLFSYEDPLGRSIYLPDHEDYYTIVGVMKHRNASAAIGGSLSAQVFENDMYIPITTLRKRIGDLDRIARAGQFTRDYVQLSQITVIVDDIDNVVTTANHIEETLKDHAEMEDMNVVVPLDLLEQAEATRMMFMVFMGLIAGVSLIVGGIGIMNIMLATVTERTREIGVRRALGARRLDIVSQFLVETIALSGMGGVTGILGGCVCPYVISAVRWCANRWAPTMTESLPDIVQKMEPQIVPWSVPVAFGISVMVGILFGIYPAIRAATMDPIEALRHE